MIVPHRSYTTDGDTTPPLLAQAQAATSAEFALAFTFDATKA